MQQRVKIGELMSPRRIKMVHVVWLATSFSLDAITRGSASGTDGSIRAEVGGYGATLCSEMLLLLGPLTTHGNLIFAQSI